MFFQGETVAAVRCGRLLLAACALVSACAAQAQQGGPRTGAPATPVYSKDGTVAVYAPLSKAGYRMPVLSFVCERREELQRAFKLKLGTPSCPLEIAIGSRSDGDTRVLTARLRDSAGGVRERIELPDPETADLARFRRAICVALLRGWMVEAGGTEETMRDLPSWLIDGALRYMDRETRQSDVDRTLLLWSRACLPPASDLLAFQSLAATREPAVAAVLASWFLEKRQSVSGFETVLRGAANGTNWTPEAAGTLIAGTNDLFEVDACVDRRLLAEGHVVSKPGLTTAGVVRRFRSHLLLYPPFFDKTLGQNRTWCSFQEAAVRSGDPDVRRSAASQLSRVQMAAFGRDGMLLAVSEAYAAFLKALAGGAPQGELSRLLMDAEGMRRELEGKTARGAVLQRTVEGG